MTTITYVEGAERMVTAVRLTPDGLHVRFADDREGVIPLADLRLPAAPHHVGLPRPHLIQIHLADGRVEEVPWDFARHFADEGYRARSEATATKGRRLLGEQLRALRAGKQMTQRELAERAGVSRVTIARIESGDQLPRYRTLAALAEGLELPMGGLLGG